LEQKVEGLILVTSPKIGSAKVRRSDGDNLLHFGRSRSLQQRTWQMYIALLDSEDTMEKENTENHILTFCHTLLTPAICDTKKTCRDNEIHQ
jgi:hypothetical protein